MFGNFLKFEVFGTSHGKAIRFSLKNFPLSGATLDLRARTRVAALLKRRRPGTSALVSSRREPDEVEWSVHGAEIRGRILNCDVRREDYDESRTIPRPHHADLGAWAKLGAFPSGGGKHSGRLTVALTAAGGLCLAELERRGISISASHNVSRAAIERAKVRGESVGGEITCVARGVPPALGGPLFEGIESALSAAIFGIPGVIGIRFENGGLSGGITTGDAIRFVVRVKPTPTTAKRQESIDLLTMKRAFCELKGRHDPCIAVRAVPVVEALTAFVILDSILMDEAHHVRICLTLTGKTLKDDLEQFVLQRYFVDLLELRLDLLKSSERAAAKVDAFLKKIPPSVPVILTKRLTDMRFSDGRRIRAFHDFKNPVRDVVKQLKSLSKDGAIPKIAFMPRSLADVSRLFRSSSSFHSPCVLLAMGPLGLATRILASRLGSAWVYCGGLGSLGQISPRELIRTYRFRSTTKGATLFGVTGYPLARTRSPELQNAAFAEEDVDAVMIPCPARTAREALAFMKAMKMRGMAVTIPHKETIIPLLDKLDPLAKSVGAVNTISFEKGKYVGYNTDVIGFTKALEQAKIAVRGKSVAVLGAGGAAKAVVYALKRLGAKRIEVFHRTTPPHGFELIVNATPVDPIPDYQFTGREILFDLNYCPDETPLMTRALKAGARAVNGQAMLACQAQAQREIWFR